MRIRDPHDEWFARRVTLDHGGGAAVANELISIFQPRLRTDDKEHGAGLQDAEDPRDRVGRILEAHGYPVERADAGIVKQAGDVSRLVLELCVRHALAPADESRLARHVGRTPAEK